MANTSGIPKEVIDFVIAHIHSVEQLEVLLLLRDDPSRAWTVREVNAVIRSSEESVKNKLRQLADVGLLSLGADESFAYAPKDAQLAECISGLAAAYRDRRSSMIELIYSKPVQAMKSFSDAFIVRKDKKNG